MAIRKPFCVLPLALSNLTAGNARSNAGVGHLALPQYPGMIWRSEGNSNLWARGMIPAGSEVNFMSLMAANAQPGTTIRLRLGNTQADVDGVAPYDSGALPFIDPARTRGDRLYHSHLEIGTVQTARWWRIDISGHAGDFSASALILGKKREPSNFYNRDRQIGFEDLGGLEIARSGVVAETPGAVLRTLLFRLQWVSDEEFWTLWAPLVQTKGKRQITFWCFDPEATVRRQDKTFLGFFTRDLLKRGNDFPLANQMDFELRALDFGQGPLPPPTLHYLPWAGQSLQGGNARGANHTYAQEHGILAFPRQSTSPTAWEPALSTSQSVTGVSAFGAGYPNGEMPMFGMSYIGELLAAETGKSLADSDLQLLIACNATGSTTIAQNQKGGSSGNFERVISQVASAVALAPTISPAARCDAVMWNQGESDSNYATYKAALSSLQASYSTDIRAVIPGDEPVKLILNQTNSITGSSSAIARAQFDAQAENTDIIMSTPKYMAEYYDALHVVARDAKWIGAYDALAWYHTVILGQRWQPLHFAIDSIAGNEVTLIAVGNVGPLVIDETTIPAQTQTNMVRGFTCVTAGNATVAVTAAVLVGANRIRVTLASYAAGHKLRYAIAPGVTRPSAEIDGEAPYTGGAGNIRDSLGDTIPMFRGNGVNRPMHKWAAAQEIIL